MAFSNGYIFGFASAVCVICSLAVASAATGLKDMQDLNKERDLRSNILDALGLQDAANPVTGEAIDTMWDERVKVIFVGADGAEVTDVASGDINGDGALTLDDAVAARQAAKNTDAAPSLMAVYVRLDEGQPAQYGIPVYGKGLWGPISGYIAVDTGGATVQGVTFFAPKETPGLGAEIMKPPFKEQWAGKKLVDDGKTVPIRVAKGDAEQLYPDEAEHWVDGVSGATITCRGVTAMMEDGVSHYDSFLTRLRAQGG